MNFLNKMKHLQRFNNTFLQNKMKFATLEQSMVNVSEKRPTIRTATAECVVRMNKEAFTQMKMRQLQKGDAISIAETAGIIASKQTSTLVFTLPFLISN